LYNFSYIYCSVLAADKTESIEHFWNKKLGEDYLESQGIPFIALRPGAFLDQADDYLGEAIKRDDWYAISAWDETIREYSWLSSLFCQLKHMRRCS
jgi:uncharacterized protein YbjT (DUF2867 family)